MNPLWQAITPADGRENNLKLLRIVLSSSVIYAHSYAVITGSLGGIHEPVKKWLGVPLGHLAVNAFFVISGFTLAPLLWTDIKVA